MTVDWLPGYSHAELAEAQGRYGLRFPPELIELLLERRPARGYDWSGDEEPIRRMLAYPLEMLLFDVENGFWWPDWDAWPRHADDRRAVVAAALVAAPRLIPLIGHRFIPESPHEAGNPVFSMHGFDTIYYGADLKEFFAKELGGIQGTGVPRHIPFWSDLVEGFDRAYDFYAASSEAKLP